MMQMGLQSDYSFFLVYNLSGLQSFWFLGSWPRFPGKKKDIAAAQGVGLLCFHSENLPRLSTETVTRAKEAVCHYNAKSSARIFSKTKVDAWLWLL